MINKQISALDSLKLKMGISEFKTIYVQEIEYLKQNKITDLKYNQIVLAYFLNLKRRKKISEKINTKKLMIRYPTFIRYIQDFIGKQNEFYSNKGYPKRIKLSNKVKINKNLFYSCITILGDGQKELTYSSKKIESMIQRRLVIFLDKEANQIIFIEGEKNLIQQLKFSFLRKGIKSEPIEPQLFPENFFDTFFKDNDIKIYQIGLQTTEISVGDETIIRSKSGDGRRYYKKFIDFGVLKKENFGVYDLENIRFTYKDSGFYNLEFNKKKDYTKEVIIRGRDVHSLPLYIKNVVGKENYWYSKLDNGKMLRILIYNGFLALYTKSYNKILTKLIENLELNHFLSISPIKKYRCENPNCDMFHIPTSSKICKEPLCNKNNKEYLDYYQVQLNFKKIISKTGDSIKKGGFIQKYKTLTKNAFELETNPFIIRLEDKKNNYAYILFNQDGLTKEDIEKIKRYGLPFLIINFKGELEQDFGNLVVEDAGNLFLSIIEKNFNPFLDSLKKLSKNIYLIKIDAFEKSLKKIKSHEPYSPNDFEAIVFSFFNLMFPDCIKWGGPNVADGGCIFNPYKKEYLVWDAKRYNVSSLLTYVRNKLEKKDLNYLKKFNENELVKTNGKLKYYLYITSNTKKNEFLQIKDEFKQLVKRDRDLNKIFLLCVNKIELIKLADFFKKHQKEIIELNRSKFLTILRNGFNKNEGYFIFDNIVEELKAFIKKERVVPLAKELR